MYKIYIIYICIYTFYKSYFQPARYFPTNTPRAFHFKTTWKRSFPPLFNVEYTWYVCRVACRQLRIPARADFLENMQVFFLITMTGKQVETLEQFFTGLPVLADQATHHFCSSNLNLLEHLPRPRRFYLKGSITNLYPFIQGSLE